MAAIHARGKGKAKRPAKSVAKSAAKSAAGRVMRRDAPGDDGRYRRTVTTHGKILAAMIDIMARLDGPMTVAQVAQAAGVSVRTVFLHFPDFETLWHEGIDSVRERFDSLVVGIGADAPLAARLDAWLRLRADLFERQARYRRAGTHMLPHSSSMRHRRAQHRQLYRQKLRQTFAPELASVPGRQGAQLFEALAAIADWDFWESLREGQRLSVPAARIAWRRALEAILASIVALGRR